MQITFQKLKKGPIIMGFSCKEILFFRFSLANALLHWHDKRPTTLRKGQVLILLICLNCVKLFRQIHKSKFSTLYRKIRFYVLKNFSFSSTREAEAAAVKAIGRG